MRCALFAAIAFASVAAFADGIYKWVDEKGVTHYGEAPPDDDKGKKATKMDIKTNPAPISSGNVDWKAKELESRTQNVQKVQEERAQAAKDAEEAKQRKAQCQAAMRQLNLYSQQVPVYNINDKGERVYVEDADRQRRMDDARDTMRKYCES